MATSSSAVLVRSVSVAAAEVSAAGGLCCGRAEFADRSTDDLNSFPASATRIVTLVIGNDKNETTMVGAGAMYTTGRVSEETLLSGKLLTTIKSLSRSWFAEPIGWSALAAAACL